MVGYKIEAEDTTLYLRLLALCPYRDFHYSNASVKLQDGGIDKQEFDLVEEETKGEHNSQPLEGKTLRVTSEISGADEATVLFIVRME